MKGWRFTGEAGPKTLVTRVSALELSPDEKLVWLSAAAEKTLNVETLSRLSGIDQTRVREILDRTITTIGVEHLSVERE